MQQFPCIILVPSGRRKVSIDPSGRGILKSKIGEEISNWWQFFSGGDPMHACMLAWGRRGRAERSDQDDIIYGRMEHERSEGSKNIDFL